MTGPSALTPALAGHGDGEASLRAEVARLNKMVQALMNRAERAACVQASEFSMFQAAIMLEDKVRTRTRELEAALLENERINGALQRAQEEMVRLLESERELRVRHELAERRYRLIFENAQIGIFVIDHDGALHSWNPALARMFGLPASASASAQPAPLAALLGDCDGRVAGLIDRALAQQAPAGGDLECGAGACAGRWINLVLNPIGEGALQGVASDITEFKIAESRARAQAERDPLTKLLNRRGLERLVAGSRRGRSGGGGRAFLRVDLDGFKQVNDTYGHEAGDAVLCSVARQLEAAVRQGDIVARLGGDEFVLALEGMSSPDVAGKVAEKVVAAVREPIFLAGGGVARVGASVGVALSRDGREPFESVLSRADRAMYRAKEAGKSQYRFDEPA